MSCWLSLASLVSSLSRRGMYKYENVLSSLLVPASFWCDTWKAQSVPEALESMKLVRRSNSGGNSNHLSPFCEIQLG